MLLLGGGGCCAVKQSWDILTPDRSAVIAEQGETICVQNFYLSSKNLLLLSFKHLFVGKTINNIWDFRWFICDLFS